MLQKDYKNPKILETLYWKEGLSSTEISQKLGVSNSPILYWMKKHNIPRRQPKRIIPEKYKIPKELLAELYLRKKLSIKQISKKLDISYETIRLRLFKHGIPVRQKYPEEKYKISKRSLEILYLKNKLSIRQIAKKLNVSDRKIIWSRLVKYDIPRRTISEATTIYQKVSFSGNLKEKAYIIGLRTGDFSANKRYKLVRVMGSTTKLNQLKMFKNVFGKYGHAHQFISKTCERKNMVNLLLFGRVI